MSLNELIEKLRSLKPQGQCEVSFLMEDGDCIFEAEIVEVHWNQDEDPECSRILLIGKAEGKPS